MTYLDSFTFASEDQEFNFIMEVKRKCYDSFYPFGVLSRKSFSRVDFEPITIFYGGNGSGKTTALNIIAQKVGLPRVSVYNRSNFLEDYLKLCDFTWLEPLPNASCIMTSDDVFQDLLSSRKENNTIDEKRETLFDTYLEAKYSTFTMKSLEDYGRLKQVNSARRHTQSQFVRRHLEDNRRIFSNGESAFRYFAEKIQKNGLFLLDEPENSLSPKRQIELAEQIEDLAICGKHQFVIATHSPFFLAMKGAKIYDLDAYPVDVKRWTELSHVKDYYQFFKKHREAFGEE